MSEAIKLAGVLVKRLVDLDEVEIPEGHEILVRGPFCWGKGQTARKAYRNARDHGGGQKGKYEVFTGKGLRIDMLGTVTGDELQRVAMYYAR